DRNVIGVVERCRAPLERGVVEPPLGRSLMPDEFREVAPVFVVAGAAPIRRKIELVPPLELRLRRQRLLAGLLAADEIAAHGDEALAALRPERRDDVTRPRAPVETGQYRLLDLERVHQAGGVEGNDRWLTVAKCVGGEKASRTVAAQIGNDHATAL